MKRLQKFINERGPSILLYIAALVVCLVVKHYSQHGPRTEPVPTDTIIVRDTFIVVAPAPVVERYVPIEVERIDTQFVVQDYQMLRVYKDTIITKYGNITVTDTVYNNQLKTQAVDYDLMFVPPDRTRNNSIAIGGGMSPMSAMATIAYKRKRWTYEGGYDFRQKVPMVKVSYDLFRW